MQRPTQTRQVKSVVHVGTVRIVRCISLMLYMRMYDKGFDNMHKVLSFHGEKYPSVREETDVVSESIKEMADIVNDFLGTSNVNDRVDDTHVDGEDEVDSNVAELLSKLQEELHPGCTQSSSMEFTAQLMHIKTLYKWTNESVNMLFKLGLGYEMIHACENDCILFWKENACDTSLYRMAGPVATMTVGSAGGSPPRREDASTIPSHCQSAPDAPARNGRGKAKGNDIVQYVERRGKIPIRWESETQTYKVLGTLGTWYYTTVGMVVRDCTEQFHDTWDQVPPDQKMHICQKMLDWFVMDFNDNVTCTILNRDCKSRYNDWKNRIHDNFKKTGGVDKMEQARRCP